MTDTPPGVLELGDDFRRFSEWYQSTIEALRNETDYAAIEVAYATEDAAGVLDAVAIQAVADQTNEAIPLLQEPITTTSTVTINEFMDVLNQIQEGWRGTTQGIPGIPGTDRGSALRQPMPEPGPRPRLFPRAGVPPAGLPPTIRLPHTTFGGPPPISLTTGFDITNVYAAEYARAHAADLVVQISTRTREAVNAIVQRAFREGVPPAQLADVIRNIVGLHSRWATAVYNYQRGLMNRGASEAFANKMGARYYNRLVKSRSLTIARTEIMRASNYGRLAGWQEVADNGLLSSHEVGKVWLTAPANCCPVCCDMDGIEVRGLDGLFDTGYGQVLMPPLHPNCRCTVYLAELPNDERLANRMEDATYGQGEGQTEAGADEVAAEAG